MTELYLAKKDGLYDRVREILSRRLGKDVEILRTAAGKPYIEGDPLFFSLSHSGKRAVITVCEEPVGVDLECYTKRSYPHVLRRFSQRERAEIKDARDFLLHWTAREAFVKMKGATLAKMFKSMEYYGGNLYLDGKLQPCRFQKHDLGFGVATVCTEN